MKKREPTLSNKSDTKTEPAASLRWRPRKRKMRRATRLGGLFVLTLLAALSVGFVGTVAQRSQSSTKIEKSVEGMKAITSKPYSFDQQGTLLGRTEVDRQTWNDLAKQLSDNVARARPSDIDAQALDDLAHQLIDPIAWDPNILDFALGHIGSRAIENLVQMIKTSPDSLIRYHLSNHMAAAAAAARNIDDHAINEIAALLDHSDRVVR